MTKIDEAIIRYITDYYRKNKFYPSYEEIADGVSRAKATIHTHMEKLEAEGIIVRKSDRSSQYRLINMDFICRQKSMELCSTSSVDQVNEMMKHICDSLCKYPIMLSSQDDLEEVCAECEIGGYAHQLLNLLEKQGGGNKKCE